MTAIQKIVYDSVRSFGYCYLSTDADGTINLDTRPPSNRIALFTNGYLYEVRAGKYRCVTFR